MNYLLDPDKNLTEAKAKIIERNKIRKAQNEILYRKHYVTDTTYKFPEEDKKGRMIKNEANK